MLGFFWDSGIWYSLVFSSLGLMKLKPELTGILRPQYPLIKEHEIASHSSHSELFVPLRLLNNKREHSARQYPHHLIYQVRHSLVNLYSPRVISTSAHINCRRVPLNVKVADMYFQHLVTVCLHGTQLGNFHHNSQTAPEL